MKTVSEMLRDADPVRHEPPIADAERDRLRRTIVAAGAGAVTRRMSPAWLRRVAVAAAVGVVVGIAVVGSRNWFGGSATLQAAVRFEVRMAEMQPAAGLTEATIAATGNRVYLHPETVVTNEDIAGASVIPHQDGAAFDVGITFTPEGGEKMRRATSSHMGAPMAILLDGELVMAPTVRSAVSTKALITGRFTKAEAERIANGVLVR